MILGFSSGAIAPGDPATAIAATAHHGATAIELSALRWDELEPLLEGIPDLPLAGFQHVSVHAPSRLPEDREALLVESLAASVPVPWPLVVHPDMVRDPSLWTPLGHRLCLENMDRRKAVGRTVGELEPLFEALPEATFCFDLAHAVHVDPTLAAGRELLAAFGDRLAQLHLSDLTPEARHRPLSTAAGERLLPLIEEIPPTVPVILESPVTPSAVAAELAGARRLWRAAQGV
ncbi:MAG: hypothetical protein AAF604_03500 [Acidobacteriota bacterium]